MTIEVRCQETGDFTIEERGEGDSKTSVLIGYGAVFNSLSQNLGGFREQIAPGAFDKVLEDDVRALFNHDPSLLLGRNEANTLRLSVDGTGLRYEIDLPDTSIGRDVAVSVKRGDISGSSFSFQVMEDSWHLDDDDREIRTIVQVSRLKDVGPVTYPAYLDATVAKRSLDARHEDKDCVKDLNVLKLELLRRSI